MLPFNLQDHLRWHFSLICDSSDSMKWVINISVTKTLSESVQYSKQAYGYQFSKGTGLFLPSSASTSSSTLAEVSLIITSNPMWLQLQYMWLQIQHICVWSSNIMLEITYPKFVYNIGMKGWFSVRRILFTPYPNSPNKF